MHQFGIQILEPNSNSNKRDEMKNKIEKEEKGCRPRKPPRPARPAPASQPNRPANPSRLPSARTRPTSRPSASPTPAHPSASLAATTRWTPHVSHPRLQCRLPHPRLNRLRDRRPTAVAGAGQGVTPGAWPCPLGAAPTQPCTAVGWDARLRSSSISSRRTPGSMAELGYKSP